MALEERNNCASLTHSLAARVVTMDTLTPPSELQLTGNVSDNWAKFRQKFEIYLEATSSAGKAQRVKTSMLLHVIGEEALELCNTFAWDIQDVTGQVIANQSMVLKHVFSIFDEFRTSKKNLTFERHKLFSYQQKQGKTIDQFITELRCTMRSCELAPLENSLLLTQLVRGISDNSVRDKLLRVVT